MTGRREQYTPFGYGGAEEYAERPVVLLGVQAEAEFPDRGFSYGSSNNNNNHYQVSASAPMAPHNTEFKRETSALAESDVYPMLKNIASSEHFGASQFFKYLDSAPTAKASMLKALSSGQNVAIFAPSNKAMAALEKEMGTTLRAQNQGRSKREAFAAQHMAIDLHDQIAEARLDEALRGGQDDDIVHAAPTVNASMHIGFEVGDDGRSHDTSLYNSEGINRATASSHLEFKYKGSSVHIINKPLVASTDA